MGMSDVFTCRYKYMHIYVCVFSICDWLTTQVCSQSHASMTGNAVTINIIGYVIRDARITKDYQYEV